MMKTAILAAILGSAAAFAPAQSGKASTALRAFEDEVRKDIVAICIPMGGRLAFRLVILPRPAMPASVGQ